MLHRAVESMQHTHAAESSQVERARPRLNSLRCCSLLFPQPSRSGRKPQCPCRAADTARTWSIFRERPRRYRAICPDLSCILVSPDPRRPGRRTTLCRPTSIWGRDRFPRSEDHRHRPTCAYILGWAVVRRRCLHVRRMADRRYYHLSNTGSDWLFPRWSLLILFKSTQ